MQHQSIPARRARRRSPLALGVVATILALLFAFPATAHVYTDLRWFRSVGFESVFGTILRTQLVLGVCVGTVVFLFLYANMRLALQGGANASARSLDKYILPDGFMQIDLAPLARRLVLPVSIASAFIAATIASQEWQTWLQFAHASSFGTADPIFGRDVGYYVFALPLVEMACSAGMSLLVITAIASAVVHGLLGRFTLQGLRSKAEPRTRMHLSVLGAAFFVLLALDAYIASSQLLQSSVGPVRGASYADVHARLPALRLQIAVALIGAVLILASITRKRLAFVGLAIALYLGTELLAVRVYPAMVHRFSVVPNEADKEAPYIRHNIEATRAAYGLAGVVEKELSGNVRLTVADIERNRATIENVRLWDHQMLLDTFAQIQEIRTYYEFGSVDNDRYLLDGDLRQTMLSPRELAAESLPNRTWINEHFTFTHGYGLTLGPVNQATNEGLPVLFIKDIPPTSSISRLRVTRPQIYFGELTNDHVFVRTKSREFDYPSGEQNVYAQYTGRDGVRLDSLLTRLLIAVRVGTLKVLLSDDMTPQSRVLLYRKIQDRVRRIAPFLVYDRDPYMVIRDNGHLFWIQDAYTTTNRYPYSEPTVRGLNYIRNSVKVVVDAYNGTIDFYAVESRDPVLETWRKAFPRLLRPLSEMPSDLRRHLRYPEDLFRIQAEALTVYHMDRAELVYNREDQWEIPAIAREEGPQSMEPYYTIMRLPGETEEEFILMLPFTPKRKENLSAWMVARMDGEHLGQLVTYTFPKDRLVFGPQQIMNRINQDAEISRQISLWDQRGSQAILGTLLVIPIEESLIYVCPLYLRSSGGRIPELKRVIAVYESRIAMAPTLDAAVASVFGATEGPSSETRATAADAAERANAPAPAAVEAATGSDTVGDETGVLSPALNVRAKQLFDRAIQAQRRGDWAGYGRELEALSDVLERLSAQSRGSRVQEAGGTETRSP